MNRVAHRPVLLVEVIQQLAPAPGDSILDCTLGMAGHGAALLERAGPDGRLVGIDRDPAALRLAEERLAELAGAVRLIQGRFEDRLPELASAEERFPVILMDLGVSSLQLDRADRGFSLQREGPLDMRMDPTGGITAAELLARESAAELERILREWGEERWARRLAGRIVESRSQAPLATTTQLVELVERAIPRRHWPRRIHPATRTFQALRIAVNRELVDLQAALETAFELLPPEGRLGVIAFHSLEDRIVKRFFRRLGSACICPPEQPVCRCSGRPRADLLTRRPIRPGEEELSVNPRARSARLRVIRRRGQPA